MKHPFIISTVVFLATASTAFALPTIKSTDDQSFTQNSASVQLKDIVITEDATASFIKAGSIEITIPASLEMIFDTKRTLEEVALYGTAVTSGKVDAVPKITFDGKDKTLVIPVKADFSPGESVTIIKVFAEGFHASPAQSESLIMTVGGSSTAYLDTYSKFIHTDSKEDTNTPDTPKNFTIKEENGTLILAWSDPTDLDLQTVQVLRGKNASPSGMPYTEVAKGIEKFVDTDVKIGDTVKYILRATDGKNFSTLTEEITITVTGVTTPAEPEEITPEPAPGEDEEVSTVPDDPITSYCAGFLDIHSADELCTAAIVLKGKGVFQGYDDATFRPDKEINRAEMLKVFLVFFEKELTAPYTGTFSDVQSNAWYTPFIAAALNAQYINGYHDGTFRPNQTISKVEFYKMLFVIAGVENKETIALPFVDIENNNYTKWYLPFVSKSFEYGLEIGDAKGYFYPGAMMTRGQVAQKLYEYSAK